MTRHCAQLLHEATVHLALCLGGTPHTHARRFRGRVPRSLHSTAAPVGIPRAVLTPDGHCAHLVRCLPSLACHTTTRLHNASIEPLLACREHSALLRTCSTPGGGAFFVCDTFPICPPLPTTTLVARSHDRRNYYALYHVTTLLTANATGNIRLPFCLLCDMAVTLFTIAGVDGRRGFVYLTARRYRLPVRNAANPIPLPAVAVDIMRRTFDAHRLSPRRYSRTRRTHIATHIPLAGT